MPGKSSFATSPALSSCARSRSRPSGVMPPSLQPFASRMSPSARAVPEEPTASFQCPAENSRTMVSQLDARGELGLLQVALGDLAVGKELQL